MHSGKSAYQSNLLANGCVQNDPSNIETVIDVYISTTNEPAPVTSEACDESYLACAFFPIWFVISLKMINLSNEPAPSAVASISEANAK